MYAFSFALFFGVIGLVVGNMVSSGNGNSNDMLLMWGSGGVFAILGAFVGSSIDIVNAIKDQTAKPIKEKPRVIAAAAARRKSG